MDMDMDSPEPYPSFPADAWPAGTTLLPPQLSTDTSDLMNFTDPANGTGTSLGAIYSATQTALIVIVAGLLISITVVGNIMVMVSFHIDKQLQTISNYFLFSLAVADFAIGLISMPLFTVYQVMGKWVMGPIVCDTWLSLDYLASNASVLNLLIISFDRYFSVTRPLTYRARRTNQRAAAMIACAWGISLVLWPPWIYAWPYIEGKRTVEPDECYIQFLQTNHYWTFGTAIAAFYLPVLIMCGLYYRIWLETEQRQRDLTHLQAGKNSSRRSNSSSEPGDSYAVTPEPTRRGRLEHASSGEGEDSLSSDTKLTALFKQVEQTRWQRLAAWCRGESGRRRRTFSGFCTPTTTDTPLPGVPRWLALAGGARLLTPKPHPKLRHTRSDTAAGTAYLSRYGRHEVPSPLPALRSLRRNRSAGALGGRVSPTPSGDSVYTIVIKLPEAPAAGSANSGSITMRCEPESPALGRVLGVTSVTDVSGVTAVSDAHQPHCPLSRHASRRQRSADDDELSSDGGLPLPPPPPVSRRPSQLPDFRIPLNARVIPKQLVRIHNPKKKKKREEKKQDRKAAKTLSAILLAFIITWTPYNVLVLIRVMLECDDCIPTELWNFSYYLCYINSTVNPLCYALCNASFRRTYVKILTCTWHKNKHQAAGRLHYN